MALVALPGSMGLATAVGGFLYVLHFLWPLVILLVVRRRGTTKAAFQAPLATVTTPLAFVMCLALLAASGPVGLLGGGVWLLAGVLVYGTSQLAPLRNSAEDIPPPHVRGHPRRLDAVPDKADPAVLFVISIL